MICVDTMLAYDRHVLSNGYILERHGKGHPCTVVHRSVDPDVSASRHHPFLCDEEDQSCMLTIHPSVLESSRHSNAPPAS